MLTPDVLIVGGGAAGLTAALVLSRARRFVVVVDAGQPRNAPAAHMHGFLGSGGLPPSDLLAAGRREVLGYGANLIPGTVTSITHAESETGAPQFRAALDGGTAIAARRILVSTGLRDDIPDIPGLKERWGRDVLHCPYCHGFAVFVRPRFVPNSDLLAGLGCESNADGWTRIDPTGRTSVKGVWAAGNAVNPRAQVITAAGEGSAAAIAINNDLVEDDIATALCPASSGEPTPTIGA